MDKRFVYPANHRNELYRAFTGQWRELKNEPYDLVYDIASRLPKVFVETEISFDEEPVDLSKYQWDPTTSTQWFYMAGGVNLCNGSKYPQMGLRLATKGMCDSSGPTALEPLTFGVGAFRKTFCKQTLFQSVVGEAPHKKTDSDLLRINARYIVPTERSEADQRRVIDRITWESTNLIYGDSLGEIEQLLRRREDKEFLQAYLQTIQETGRRIDRKNPAPNNHMPYSGRVSYVGMPYLSGRVLPAWVDHVENQGIWDKPPQSTEELVERAQFIWDNTFHDIKTKEVLTAYKHESHMD